MSRLALVWRKSWKRIGLTCGFAQSFRPSRLGTGAIRNQRVAPNARSPCADRRACILSRCRLGRARDVGRAPARSPDTLRRSVSFVLEGNLQPGPVGFHLALLNLQIELGDLRDPQIPKRFSRSLDGRGRRLLPGLSAGPDQLDDLVDALRHG